MHRKKKKKMLIFVSLSSKIRGDAFSPVLFCFVMWLFLLMEKLITWELLKLYK